MGRWAGLAARWRETPEPVQEERRIGVRHTTVLQIAKLIGGLSEELCIVRDISSGGLKAQSYHDLRADEAITIELRTGFRADGRVAWADGGMFGMEFDEQVSVLSLLTHCSVDDRIGRLRPPRLRACLPARLRLGRETVDVELCDVSLSGMKIRVDRVLETDRACQIAPVGMPARAAHIRWSRDGYAGVLLTQPLAFEEFGAWRRELAAPAGHL